MNLHGGDVTPKSENRKTTPKPDNPDQSKRFEDKARELEADESGKAFERALKATLPKVKKPPVKAGR